MIFIYYLSLSKIMFWKKHLQKLGDVIFVIISLIYTQPDSNFIFKVTRQNYKIADVLIYI